MSPPQLKSNVISLDCHISQYATVCQQLQAEVRSHLGSLARGQVRSTGVSPGCSATTLRSAGALRVWAALFQVAALREKLRVYEAGAQAPLLDPPRSPKPGRPHQP